VYQLRTMRDRGNLRRIFNLALNILLYLLIPLLMTENYIYFVGQCNRFVFHRKSASNVQEKNDCL
jgi:hypothetical protein